jgi:flavin-dependent dehydrogenase
MFPRGNIAPPSLAKPDRAQLNIQQSNDFNGRFEVQAMPPFPAGETLRFGERLSATARVTFRTDAPAHTCWIEAVDTGWLFLIPDGFGEAWLLTVGGDARTLVQDAPLIGPLIDVLAPTGSQFDTSPRMLAQLAEDDWLACGTAAIAFDPICGDGTAQAAREGILASAVVGALARGEEPALLATHYHSLLLSSLRRHLQLSLPFYANGGAGRWWHEQYAAARAGYEQTTALLAKLPEPRFALHGFDLVRREQAA